MGRGRGNPGGSARFEELANAFTYDASGFRHPELLSAAGQAEVRALDNALYSREYDGTISRGIRMTDSQLAALQEGQIIDQRGISSWTNEPNVAEQFAQDARRSYGDGAAVVFVNEGGTSHGADISHLSSRYDEFEVAVSSRARQKIIRIEKPESPWGTYYIHVKEVEG